MVGNGGSASIASHLAVDFTKAAGVRSITFNESSFINLFWKMIMVIKIG